MAPNRAPIFAMVVSGIPITRMQEYKGEIAMGYKTSFEAETAMLSFEKDLQKSSESTGLLESEMNDLRRKMLDMEIRKNDLKESIRKGRENIKRIESELRTCKIEFWRLKHENL
jgi:chromosome segregation ATPase